MFELTVGEGQTLSDGAAMGALVDRVAANLGAEARVAASITFLGIAARLWNVSVRAAVLDGTVPDLSAVTWTDDRGSVRLHVTEVVPLRGDLEQLVWDQVVEGHLRGLLERTRSAYGLAEGLLWGNVASGLSGLGNVLPEARTFSSHLLHRVPLDTAMDGPRRRSCCLFHKVPGAGLCGDCALDRVPERVG